MSRGGGSLALLGRVLPVRCGIYTLAGMHVLVPGCGLVLWVVLPVFASCWQGRPLVGTAARDSIGPCAGRARVMRRGTIGWQWQRPNGVSAGPDVRGACPSVRAARTCSGPAGALVGVGVCIVCMRASENAGVCALVRAPVRRVRACMRLVCGPGWRWGYAATRTQPNALCMPAPCCDRMCSHAPADRGVVFGLRRVAPPPAPEGTGGTCGRGCLRQGRAKNGDAVCDMPVARTLGASVTT